MVDKISLRRITKLLSISAKMDLLWLLRDTKFAMLGISGDMVNNAATVSGVFLIASRFGWIGSHRNIKAVMNRFAEINLSPVALSKRHDVKNSRVCIVIFSSLVR
jgi:hypothetical protein